MSAVRVLSPEARTVEKAASAKPKQQVQHLFWLADLEFADLHGLEAKTLCGLWRPPEADSEPDPVPIVGGLIPLTEPEDCKRCVKTYQKRCRENWARSQG